MFGDFINYIQQQKRYSNYTVISYQKDLEDFVSYLNVEHSSCPIFEVNEQMIRAFVVSLVKSGIANRSINRKISTLRSFYKFSIQQGLSAHSPLKNLKSLKVSKQVQIPFSKEEMNLLLDKELIYPNTFAGHRDYLMILLFYTLGIRRSELLNLVWSDVDFGNKNIRVFGKRSKERLIPLLDETIFELKNYKELILQNFAELPKKILVDEKGNEISQNLVYKLVKMYLSKVSVKQKRSPHVLRHTFATHLLSSGAEISAIKELLGHESLASTQVYTHVDINELKKVFNHSHPRGSELNS